MSQVFEGYERQYCDLSANLSRKCSSTSLLSDQGTFKVSIQQTFTFLGIINVILQNLLC